MSDAVGIAPPLSAPARSLPFSRQQLTGWVMIAPTVLFLLVCFVWPVIHTLMLSVTAEVVDGVTVEGWTINNYLRLFSSDLYFRILLRTLRVAALASVASIVFSYPLAIAIARGGPSLARIVTIVVVAPLLVNVVVRSYGWSAILSKNGALNFILKSLGLASNPGQLLYTEWAVMIACVHVYLPFMVMPLATAIGRIDRSVEEAARIAGATRASTFWRVVFPLSLPGLSVGVTLVFSLTAAAYVMPQILGGNFSPLLGTLIEQQMVSLSDWPFGSAISGLLIVMVLAVNLGLLHILNKRFARWTAGGTMNDSVGPGLKIVVTLILLIVIAPLVVPMMMAVSDTPNLVFPPRGFTLKWFTKVLLNPEAQHAFFFSLKLAAVVTLLSLLLGIPAAAALVRGKLPGRGLVLALVLSPLVVPLIVTGVALLQIFSMLGSHATFVQLIIGHTVVCLPYVVRAVAGALVLVNPSLEDAAAVLGAPPATVARKVIWPQIRPGVLAGGVFAFIVSFDDYPISMWLADGEHFPIPLYLHSQIELSFDPSIAAISSLMILFALLLVLLLEKVFGISIARLAT